MLPSIGALAIAGVILAFIVLLVGACVMITRGVPDESWPHDPRPPRAPGPSSARKRAA